MRIHQAITLALGFISASSTGYYLSQAPTYEAMLLAAPAIVVTLLYFTEVLSAGLSGNDPEGVVGLLVLHVALAIFGLFMSTGGSTPAEFAGYKKALYWSSLAMSAVKTFMLVNSARASAQDRQRR